MKRKLLITSSLTFVLVLAVTMMPLQDIMAQDIYGGVYTVPLGADADVLNPFTWGTTYEAAVIGHVYDALYQYDTENVPLPVIAESYTFDVTQTFFNFTIRDGLKWHDNTSLTIDDVFYTYDLLINDVTIPRRSWIFDEIVNLTIVGSHTIMVEFYSGLRAADVIIDLATQWIVPEHIWDSVGDILTEINPTPIGSGPFKLKEWAKGQYFTLERFDDYHLDGPFVDEKVLRILTEPDVEAYAFTLGDIEVLGAPSPELEAEAKTNPDVGIHTWLQDYFMYLSMNQRRYPNNVLDFRKAVMYAIDRQEIMDVARYGRGVIAPASCAMPFGEWYNPNVTEYDYSIATANSLLDALGWIDTNLDDVRETDNGTVLSFELLVSAGAQESVDSTQLIIDYMADIGVELIVTPTDWSVMWAQIGGDGNGVHDYDWCYAGWVDFWSDIHPNWAAWLFNKGMWWADEVDIPGWNDSYAWQVSDLTDEIIHEPDINIAKTKLNLVQEIIADNLPYLTMHWLGGVALYRTDEFQGWELGLAAGPNNWISNLQLQLVPEPPTTDTPGFTVLLALLSTGTAVVLARYFSKKKK